MPSKLLIKSLENLHDFYRQQKIRNVYATKYWNDLIDEVLNILSQKLGNDYTIILEYRKCFPMSSEFKTIEDVKSKMEQTSVSQKSEKIILEYVNIILNANQDLAPAQYKQRLHNHYYAE